MSNLLECIRSPAFSTITMVVLCIITLVLKLISSKVKNEKIKHIIDILPDAMIKAETEGTTPSNKLEIAIKYIKDKVKSISDNDIINMIENAIIISKNVNYTPKQEDKVSCESRISMPNK